MDRKRRFLFWAGILLPAGVLAAAAFLLGRHDAALSGWARALPRAHDDFTLWWYVENYGELATWAVVTLAAAVWAASFRIAGWKRFRPALAFLLLTELLGPGLLNLGLKYTINRPRPGDPLGFFPLFSRGPHAHDNGFPSGHTANAFVLLALAYLVPRSRPLLRRLAAACFIAWGLAVGVSRVIWGVHYPSDVLFGALITVMVEAVLWRCWFRDRVRAADPEA